MVNNHKARLARIETAFRAVDEPAPLPAIELTNDSRLIRLESLLADVREGRRPASDFDELRAILAPAFERRQQKQREPVR